MPKFENKFVYFDWSDSLRGKKVFYGDDLLTLENNALSGNTDFMAIVEGGHDKVTPFIVADDYWKFVYYDPNYECKMAYENGKTIQVLSVSGEWEDCIPRWSDADKYRIKPEEPSLQWTDLKVGDIIQRGGIIAMVTVIDAGDLNNMHIFAQKWIVDDELKEWRKV